jgi:hypothetical protein
VVDRLPRLLADVGGVRVGLEARGADELLDRQVREAERAVEGEGSEPGALGVEEYRARAPPGVHHR